MTQWQLCGYSALQRTAAELIQKVRKARVQWIKDITAKEKNAAKRFWSCINTPCKKTEVPQETLTTKYGKQRGKGTARIYKKLCGRDIYRTSRHGSARRKLYHGRTQGYYNRNHTGVGKGKEENLKWNINRF